jgi:hypothetical protein
MFERATTVSDRPPVSPELLDDLRGLADAACVDCGQPAQLLHRHDGGAASPLCRRCADRPTMPARPVSGAPLADYERYLAALMAR